MKREDENRCPYCRGEMKDGKCGDCGAWMDSYGVIHKANCQGGFHEECPVSGAKKKIRS